MSQLKSESLGVGPGHQGVESSLGGGGSPVWRQSTLQPTPQAGADLQVGVIYRPAKGKWGLRLEEPDVSYHSRLTGSPDAASHFLLSQLL